MGKIQHDPLPKTVTLRPARKTYPTHLDKSRQYSTMKNSFELEKKGLVDDPFVVFEYYLAWITLKKKCCSKKQTWILQRKISSNLWPINWTGLSKIFFLPQQRTLRTRHPLTLRRMQSTGCWNFCWWKSVFKIFGLTTSLGINPGHSEQHAVIITT